MCVFLFVSIAGTTSQLALNDDYKEQCPNIGQIIKKKLRKTCTRQLIFDRLPIINHTLTYRLNYVFKDFVAGTAVGLTAIPQGIAYAVVAGLPPQVFN